MLDAGLSDVATKRSELIRQPEEFDVFIGGSLRITKTKVFAEEDRWGEEAELCAGRSAERT